MEDYLIGVGRRRTEEQSEFWVAAEQLGHGPRNAFYDRLNEVLAEAGFDRELENGSNLTIALPLATGLCRACTSGCFSLATSKISPASVASHGAAKTGSLAPFLGYRPGESTPDYSMLSLTRDRLPLEIHWWTIALPYSGTHTAIHPRKIQSSWKPILAFSKGKPDPEWHTDPITGGSKKKDQLWAGAQLCVVIRRATQT